MTTEPVTPLVTMALPLYRSMRFFEYVVESIERCTYPNMEILVGDRHLLDDAVERLKERFPGDPRIRYITATDELNWVEHWNLLLAEANGEYFFWMPHDDSIAEGYIEALVARLEAVPDAVLAHGYLDPMSVDGRRTSIWEDPPPARECWGVRSSMRLLLGWHIGFAMRGIFRRSWAVDTGLWMRNTTGLTDADLCWLFGLSLLGRFEFVPETRFTKRFYTMSTSDQWQPLPFMELSRVISGYIVDSPLRTRERAVGVGLVWAGAVATFGTNLLNRVTGRRLLRPAHLRRAWRRLL